VNLFNKIACGSEIHNPYCLTLKPSDPYAWVYWESSPSGPIWIFGQQPSFYGASGVSVGAPTGSGIIFNGRPYVCASGPCHTNVISEWTISSDLPSGTFSNNVCPVDYEGPKPDPQTGACERTPNDGPESACVNPCVRLSNGQLAVNKSTSQCRVFPTTTLGGNQSVGGPSGAVCPTVCPSACVELWDSCPPGSAPLTTLVQTKSPTDLLSLTGPYRLDGRKNPLWPANYSASALTTLPPEQPIGGKPYTECYSYNTSFCDLPMAWQETVPKEPILNPNGPTTNCYSTCPPGTFQDPSNAKMCLFMPLSGEYDPQSYDATTPVQRVFCNPQYFNPVYWPDPYGGTQKGCQALALPSKQGSSCGQGTSAVINEFFNLEWCVPDCPEGYFFDITQSTCVATCQGSTTAPGYNKYLDYVDIYATSNRCLPTGQVDAHGDQITINCVQDMSSGRCPSIASRPPDSSQLIFKSTTQPQNVPIKHSSMNDQCPATGTGLGANFGSFQNSVRQYQQALSKSNKAVPLGECPEGMYFGDSNCAENPGLCYDRCIDGYEPVVSCSNGSTTCADDEKVYACRAKCPAPEEGLGPWTALNSPPLYTCQYAYPSGISPSDPNLWASCPDDGRYTALENSPTDVSITFASAARKEPLCVRQTYLRKNTCPVGYNEVANATGPASCVQACDYKDIIVVLPDNTVVCQSAPSQQKRHEIDFVAVADSHNARSEFRHRVSQRKSFGRGLGTDPNVSTGPPNTTGTVLKAGGVIGAVGLSFLILHFLSGRRK